MCTYIKLIQYVQKGTAVLRFVVNFSFGSNYFFSWRSCPLQYKKYLLSSIYIVIIQKIREYGWSTDSCSAFWMDEAWMKPQAHKNMILYAILKIIITITKNFVVGRLSYTRFDRSVSRVYWATSVGAHDTGFFSFRAIQTFKSSS